MRDGISVGPAGKQAGLHILILSLLETLVWFPILLYIGGSLNLSFPVLAGWLLLLLAAFIAGRLTSGLWRALLGPKWFWPLWLAAMALSVYAGLSWRTVLLLTIGAVMLWRGVGVSEWGASKWALMTVIYLFAVFYSNSFHVTGILVFFQITGILSLIAFLLSLNVNLLKSAAFHPGLLSKATLRLNRNWLSWGIGGILLAAVLAVIFLGPYIGWFQHSFNLAFDRASAGIQSPIKLPEQLMPKPHKGHIQAPSPKMKDPLWFVWMTHFFQFIGHHWPYLLAAAAAAAFLFRLKNVRTALRNWRAAFLALFQEKEQELPYTDEQHSLLNHKKKSGKKSKRASRHKGGQQGQVDWASLTAVQKVRYLFADLLIRMSLRGYAAKTGLTPSEIWADMEAWKPDGESGETDLKGLQQEAAKHGFLQIYNRARFGEKGLNQDELSKLEEIRRNFTKS